MPAISMDFAGWPMNMNSYRHPTVDMMLDEFAVQLASSNFSDPVGALPNKGNYPEQSLALSKAQSATNRCSLGRRKKPGFVLSQRMSGGLAQNNTSSVPHNLLNSGDLRTGSMNWYSSPPLPQQSPYTIQSSRGLVPNMEFQCQRVNNQPLSNIRQAVPTLSTCTSSPISASLEGGNGSMDMVLDPNISIPFTQTYPIHQYPQIEPGSVYDESQLLFNENLLCQNLCNSQLDWNYFPINAMGNLVTSPPTPQDTIINQQPCATYPFEDISYANLNETGEELIGMGLYDAPEPLKSPLPDTQLSNYGSCAVLSSPGKGLKLEETWNPPANDMEDDKEQACDEELSEADPVMEY